MRREAEALLWHAHDAAKLISGFVEGKTAAGSPDVIPATDEEDVKLLQIGVDHTGLELEVIGVYEPDRERYLIIHVMPTAWKKGGSDE